MGVLHQDVLMEVLCCLPGESLMRCCCVCTAWYLLIRRYCVPRITSSLPFLGCHIRIKASSSTNLVMGRAALPQALAQAGKDNWPPLFNIHHAGNGISPSAKDLLDSRDGLMLFRHSSQNNYVLRNQNAQQFLFIPCPPNHANFVVLAVDIKHWKPDKEMDFIKIVSFPQNKWILDVFSSHDATWVERKIKYIHTVKTKPPDDATYILDGRSVYLQEKIFRLFHMKYLGLGLGQGLVWYTIGDGDGDGDVVGEYVQLPGIGPRGTGNGSRIGCIGSCCDRIQYAQNDETLGILNIWVVNVDAGNWTLVHTVKLEVLLNLTTMLPASNAKFKPLAFSDDGLIIWTPNLVFCYYYKSRNLVPLQCSDILNHQLKHPPDDAFAFTQCLASLVYATPNYYKKGR